MEATPMTGRDVCMILVDDQCACEGTPTSCWAFSSGHGTEPWFKKFHKALSLRKVAHRQRPLIIRQASGAIVQSTAPRGRVKPIQIVIDPARGALVEIADFRPSSFLLNNRGE